LTEGLRWLCVRSASLALAEEWIDASREGCRGDKLFVDYAGDRAPVVIDRLTGEIREAWIFVAVLGASNFTYAEATWTQGLAEWIGAHTRAFEAIGGVPNLIVPDNAKTAVIKACLDRTYTEMAAHYDTAILPTRPRKPRDKAKVEAAVLIMERWILGRLRNQRFYSLAALNQAIGALLVRLNDQRPIRRLGVTRRQLLERTRPPAAQALAGRGLRLRRVAAPARRHRLSRRYRSALLQRALPLRPRCRRGAGDRANRRGSRQGERIAAHLRSSGDCKHTTVQEHMPSSHRRYADWTIDRIRRDAAAIGPATGALCELILEQRSHPEQGFRACLGIVRLVKPFGASASKRRQRGHSISVPEPTDRSSPSSTTISIATSLNSAPPTA